MKILLRFLLLLFLFAVAGCVATTPDGKIIKEDKNEKFEDVEIIQNWSGDFPVAKLNVLPAGQERLPAGYIGDAATFKNVWEVFSPATPVPEVDFADNIVVFGRNTQYYNRTTIFKVTLTNEGVAEILAMATMSATPIQDKVAMSMAIIPRKGIKYIFTAGTRLPVK
ncbi:hypothetical protein [Kaarinaea lacus]